MSTRWAKCSVPDSVGRQANSRAALPSFFSSSGGLHSNTPCCPASPTFGVLTRPGRTSLRPFWNGTAASAVRALRSKSSNSPSSFKAKPATARALLFSSPSLRVCSDAPVQFVAQAAQVFLFFPTYALRCPSSGRTKGRFTKKPPDNSEKRGAIGVNTGAFPAYSTVSRFCRHRRSAHPRVLIELPDARKHRVSILCINSAALSLFLSVGKIWMGTPIHIFTFFPAHSSTKHFPRQTYHNDLKTPDYKIPTCSDCPRTIRYLTLHFENYSL